MSIDASKEAFYVEKDTHIERYERNESCYRVMAQGYRSEHSTRPGHYDRVFMSGLSHTDASELAQNMNKASLNGKNPQGS